MKPKTRKARAAKPATPEGIRFHALRLYDGRFAQEYAKRLLQGRYTTQG
jgi:hypothetical protein